MRKRIINILLLVLICLFIFVGYFYLNKEFGFDIPCVFHKLTGYYCPGCGITRCLFSILKLDFYKAFMYNQFVFILLPFFGLGFIYKFYLYIVNKQDKLLKKIPNVVWVILLVIAIGFGFIRNLDGFEFLRP